MDSEQVQLHLTIPKIWRDELKAAADSQAISLSDLVRLVLRSFLRNRFTVDQREAMRP